MLVFGSVARGDDSAQSDLDLLIVVPGDEQVRSLRRDAATKELARALVLSRRAMLDEVALRPSFVAHLLDEGVVVRAGAGWGELREALVRAATNPRLLDDEVRRRARAVEPFADAERFVNSPVTALSHLYGIARSLVIARLLQAGIREYRWQRAFDRYAELRPELGDDIHALKELRPYYDVARARPGARLPDRRIDARDLEGLVRAVEHVAR